MAGCALVDPTEDAVPEGIVSIGFEVSAFRSCGSSEDWWLVGSSALYSELAERYAGIVSSEYEPVYARLRGVQPKPGEYGHLGAYPREFHVTEIVEMRAPSEDDCAR
jgi:hypothetical protein